MAIQIAMTGTRLAYVVRELEGTVQREITPYDKKSKEITRKIIEQPAGYLIYFPRGHVLRMKSKEELAHYGLNRKPKLINLQGLEDPNSPLGKLMMAQDAEERDNAFIALEEQVVAMATAKTGKIIMPEQVQPVGGS